jgi:hypothetical protein
VDARDDQQPDGDGPIAPGGLVNRNREFDAELRAHSSRVDIHLARAMHISYMDQWDRSRQGSEIIPKLVITPAFVLLRF